MTKGVQMKELSVRKDQKGKNQEIGEEAGN